MQVKLSLCLNNLIFSRKNSEILKAFVQSFNFDNMRLDEALRKFLETFRLPGESAEISKIMQHFSGNLFYKLNLKQNIDALKILIFRG